MFYASLRIPSFTKFSSYHGTKFTSSTAVVSASCLQPYHQVHVPTCRYHTYDMILLLVAAASYPMPGYGRTAEVRVQFTTAVELDLQLYRC